MAKKAAKIRTPSAERENGLLIFGFVDPLEDSGSGSRHARRKWPSRFCCYRRPSWVLLFAGFVLTRALRDRVRSLMLSFFAAWFWFRVLVRLWMICSVCLQLCACGLLRLCVGAHVGSFVVVVCMTRFRALPASRGCVLFMVVVCVVVCGAVLTSNVHCAARFRVPVRCLSCALVRLHAFALAGSCGVVAHLDGCCLRGRHAPVRLCGCALLHLCASAFVCGRACVLSSPLFCCSVVCGLGCLRLFRCRRSCPCPCALVRPCASASILCCACGFMCGCCRCHLLHLASGVEW